METATVESSNGVKLNTRLFKPSGDLATVLVHPYTVLGGVACSAASPPASPTEVTPPSTSTRGRASLFGTAEIQDVVAVCSWVSHTLSHRRIVLVGSSAGAPLAGSAVDKIDQVVGYVSMGYPFGLMASVLFGRHHEAILNSEAQAFYHGNKRWLHKCKAVRK